MSIDDTGPGIAEKDLESVLERFYRVENHQTPGYGIGLYIVVRVVQIHHGRLGLLHAADGQGLKVLIEFD